MKAALASVLVACSSAVSPSQVAVHFEGIRDVDEADLREVIHEGELKEPEGRRQDELWVLGALYDRGYVQAKVTSSSATRADGAVDVTFHIEEGARFRVGSLSVHERDSESALAAFHRAEAGEWFSRKLVVEDIDELRALYVERGHKSARITPIANVDPQKRTIDLDVVIDPNGA